GQEVKGYLRGGYRGLADTLRDAIVARGGEVRLQTPVDAIATSERGVVVTAGGEERFDALVAPLAPPLLSKVARGELTGQIPIPDLKYQGVVNALVVSRKPLERFYWTAIVDRSFPFQGVVETTHVIPTEWTGGRHLFYLMNYCGADSETYG